ncbi:hypothetical protein BaOVIS_011890 [Babesia ovis]|uniref:TFIIS N-terminal domain-containing protein n=1 Tax=Babesia ovis TaxID=5869 RepID=A0A9W5T9C6_BABOV|nr:hypothetical protein BaOVIS_011890 [Babesia ovis]
MSLDNTHTSDSSPPSTLIEVGGALISPSRLRPLSDRIFSRVATLSKVDGLNDDILTHLNSWYQSEWRTVHASRFTLGPAVTESLKRYFASRQSPQLTAEHLESYLNSSCLLYYGLRGDSSASSDVSKNKFFQRYYYTARENARALNSSVVMSNFVWAFHHYMRDEFANTCLLDILLQAFPAALDCFIKFRGVVYLRLTLEYLASSGKLRSSTNYLLKALALLNKLDISFPVLQSSRIGVPINGIATGGKNMKLGIDYECDSDQVKLKATDLIKKWKAIRDASMPMRVEPEPRRPVKKLSPTVQSPQEHVEQLSPVAARAPEPSAASTAPGSFVLNILDSMVEQREKERKRKLAMKEAQRNGLFKVPRTHDTEESGNTARTEASLPTISTAPTKNAPGASGGTEREKVVESRKELQSLMNFFKSFKPQVTATPTAGQSARGSSPTTSTSKLPSVQPPVRISGDKTGLSVSSNSVTNTNGVPAGPTSTKARSQNLSVSSSHVGTSIPNAGTKARDTRIPPWK